MKGESRMSKCEIEKSGEFKNQYSCFSHGIDYTDSDKNPSELCPAGEIEEKLEKERSISKKNLIEIAELLELEIPKDVKSVCECLKLDIKRLLYAEKRWINVCEIAREHCTVEAGESYLRQGIPRLAKKVHSTEEKVLGLEEDKEILRQLVKDLAEHISIVAPDSSHWLDNLGPRVDHEVGDE